MFSIMHTQCVVVTSIQNHCCRSLSIQKFWGSLSVGRVGFLDAYTRETLTSIQATQYFLEKLRLVGTNPNNASIKKGSQEEDLRLRNQLYKDLIKKLDLMQPFHKDLELSTDFFKRLLLSKITAALNGPHSKSKELQNAKDRLEQGECLDGRPMRAIQEIEHRLAEKNLITDVIDLPNVPEVSGFITSLMGKIDSAKKQFKNFKTIQVALDYTQGRLSDLKKELKKPAKATISELDAATQGVHDFLAEYRLILTPPPLLPSREYIKFLFLRKFTEGELINFFKECLLIEIDARLKKNATEDKGVFARFFKPKEDSRQLLLNAKDILDREDLSMHPMLAIQAIQHFLVTKNLITTVIDLTDLTNISRLNPREHPDYIEMLWGKLNFKEKPSNSTGQQTNQNNKNRPQ